MEHELFFEIGTEEIPAGYIRPALENLQALLGEKLRGLGLGFGEILTAATPRRLAVCVRGLADRQPDRREEFLGPPRKAAYDADNRPTKAAVGFAASRGVAVEELVVTATPKGEYVSVVQEIKGQETIALLVTLLPEVVLALSFPKSMRWGAGRISFARPIQWVVALFGNRLVPLQVGEVVSGVETRGHRFMSSAPFPVNGYDQYLQLLRDNFVVADLGERRAAVATEIDRAAQTVGGRVLPDDELIDTVTNLVEFPCGVCGTFEERFLELPASVLITAMREHQKYFCVTDTSGRLLPYFVAVNNTRVADQRLAAEGHQRVLRARLEDALFFFKADRAAKLADRVEALAGLVFQARLGTMLEKTKRVASLAAMLASRLAPAHRAVVERAALLAKADLLTAMVNEFPSLQGTMGRDYALQEGEGPAVAQAIFDHYLPVRAGDRLPDGIPGALIGVADRLDTIVGCFGIGQMPTGTTDPFGLRRLALGLIHIVENKAFDLDLADIIQQAIGQYGATLTVAPATILASVLEFLKGRYVNNLISSGIAADAVEAVTTVAFGDLVDCRARLNALLAIRSKPTFATLAAAFKRVMNIIKDNRESMVDEQLLQAGAEQQLYEVFQAVQAAVQPLLANKRYDLAMAEILRMKEPVDSFFDGVMVMAEDLTVRQNRLNLLTAIARLFLQIGDFSRMQGAAPGS